jgi:predicted Zn-ribbon and HTH transcriptional regulator
MNKDKKKMLENCPKCGSKTGYVIVEKLALHRDWDGSAQAVESCGCAKTAECIDCGYKFNADKVK